MHLADEMDPEQHAIEIQRINARRESISAEVANLHGMPVVAGLVRDGLDFTNTELWTSERKRAPLKGSGVGVYVDPWPEGVARNPARLAGESAEERKDRLELLHREVLIQRVRITYPGRDGCCIDSTTPSGLTFQISVACQRGQRPVGSMM